MVNPRNQHIEIPQIQCTDKIADESVADEHNEISKTMKDLSIIQHQTELEEKVDTEQQLRRELSMVAGE